MKTEHTFCRICEALCGLEVDVELGRVTAIRPDAQHVATSGFACQKGLRQHQMYDSPDRLRYPERRIPGTDRWERAPWSEALSDIGRRVAQIRGAHGANAIAMYVGTAAGFSVLHPIFAQGFMTGIGSKSMYSSATQDCANKFAAARHVYGFPFTQPFPDLLHTDCLIVVGANPVVSKWSFLQVPNPTRHLRAIEERGGAVFVIDPRRTETAKAAGEHLFIRPDTDVFFFLAFLHEVFAQGGVDETRVAAHMSGLASLRAVAEPWSPERCAEATGIEAATLRRLVARYLAASRTPGRGAALYSSTGVNMGSNGSLCFWLQEAVNAITGNLDRRGGTLVGRGVIDFPAFGKKSGVLLRNERSRVGDLPSVNDAFAGGLLADEILTPGPGQVRALFVTGGNPLLTMPNAGRLRDAFGKLELLVTLDIYKNETGTLADWVLPCTSPLERADLPFIFPLMLGLQARPYLQATRAVVEPDGEQRDEATIYLDLARASGVALFGSRVAQHAIELMTEIASRLRPGRQRSVPQERLLSWLLRATGQGSFAALRKHEHGRSREPHEPGTFLGQRVTTDDGRVQLAPAELVAQAMAQLEVTFARERGHRQSGQLKLITKRAVQTHNSWTHNLEEMIADGRDRNHLYVHPDDARRLGLAEGAYADVTSATATVRIGVKLLGDLMPGVVALPHGWGHQHAKGLSIASRTQGVNVNLLAADGRDNLEAVSGMANLTGIPVQVRPAAGPFDPQSWSGIAP